MGRTIMGAVVSADGYLAHDDDSVDPLSDGYGDVGWTASEDDEFRCRTTLADRP